MCGVFTTFWFHLKFFYVEKLNNDTIHALSINYQKINLKIKKEISERSQFLI